MIDAVVRQTIDPLNSNVLRAGVDETRNAPDISTTSGIEAHTNGIRLPRELDL